jgi:hypothetical protein
MRKDTDLGSLLHFTLDEPQQMLLVHTGRVVNVSVHFSNVVEVPVIRVISASDGTWAEQYVPMRNSLTTSPVDQYLQPQCPAK